MALMALKRLRKEWSQWNEEGPEGSTNPLKSLGTFEEERRLWTLEPQPTDDPESPNYFTWLAALQVSRGPFSGATFVYSITFPRDYPFKPPKMKAQFAGYPVSFEEVEAGWHVYMIPPGAAARQRRKGLVTGAAPDQLTVRWCDGDGDANDTDEEEENTAHETVVSKAFWEDNGLVLGQSPSAAIYHPLLTCDGSFCCCGIDNKWAPQWSVVLCLSFARTVVEDPQPDDGDRPVPPDSSNTMCFCTCNPAACEDLRRSSSRWHQRARRRFFTEKGVVPLCIAATEAAGEARIGIRCTSLAGTLLGELEVDSLCIMEELEEAVHDQIPLKDGGIAWKIVLPDGSCMSEDCRYRTVGSVLGFH